MLYPTVSSIMGQILLRYCASNAPHFFKKEKGTKYMIYTQFKKRNIFVENIPKTREFGRWYAGRNIPLPNRTHKRLGLI